MKKLFLFIYLIAVYNMQGQTEIKDSTHFYALVEKLPIAAGCENYSNSNSSLQHTCFNNQITKLVSENFKYPKAAKRASLFAKIYVNFIIEKDGSISNVEVVKGAV